VCVVAVAGRRPGELCRGDSPCARSRLSFPRVAIIELSVSVAIVTRSIVREGRIVVLPCWSAPRARGEFRCGPGGRWIFIEYLLGRPNPQRFHTLGPISARPRGIPCRLVLERRPSTSGGSAHRARVPRRPHVTWKPASRRVGGQTRARLHFPLFHFLIFQF